LKILRNYGLARRVLLVIAAIVLSCFSIGQSGLVFADGFTSDQLEELSQWTNWVADTCASGSADASSATTGSVYVLGDSITVRAQTAYQDSFQEAHFSTAIDASSSRSLISKGIDGNRLNGMDAITHDTDNIKSAANIVIALGTNGDDTKQNVDDAIDAVRNINKDAKIFWVDVILVGSANDAAIAPQNKAIYSEASAKNYQVISWFKAVDPQGDPQHPSKSEDDPKGYIDQSDGIHAHPTPYGSKALAKLVTKAVTGNTPVTAADSGGGCCNSAAASTLSGDTNGIRAYNFFIGKGMTPEAASGIVGNMTEESIGVEPERLQGDFTSRHPAQTLSAFQIAGGASGHDIGWGTVQFTPPSKYITVSRDKGVSDADINSLGNQLNFVWNQMKHDYPGIISSLNNAQSPEAAATVWLQQYERGNPTPTRQAYARAYYNLATKNIPLPKNVPVSKSDAGDTAAAQQDGGDASSCGASGNSDITSYNNPFREIPNIAQAGIDAGVDYSGEGDVKAIGTGVVTFASGKTGWVGGNYIAYKLSEGPAKDKTVYVAENCSVNPALKPGDEVNSETTVCHMHNSYPYIETGWAKDTRDLPLAYVDNCYYLVNPSIGAKTSTAYGVNFDKLMHRLGAPKASLLAPPITCKLPAQWPAF
jgi:hypothetical protein